MEDGYNFVNEEIYIKRLQKFRTENSVVRKFIGIQSQFYRYAMLCCKFRGDDFTMQGIINPMILCGICLYLKEYAKALPFLSFHDLWYE